jgi:hypothetical protein
VRVTLMREHQGCRTFSYTANTYKPISNVCRMRIIPLNYRDLILLIVAALLPLVLVTLIAF